MLLLNFLNNFDKNIMNFYNSTFFSVIEFILGIYVVVLFVDIILLLFQRGLGGDLRDTLIGMNVPAELTTHKNRLRKKWSKIREKIEGNNESLYKVAIIEADNIIDDLVKRMKYEGENLEDRLSKINLGQIESIEELRKAHQLRNRVIHEDDFKVDKKEAKEIIGYYESFLKEFEVLD